MVLPPNKNKLTYKRPRYKWI